MRRVRPSLNCLVLALLAFFSLAVAACGGGGGETGTKLSVTVADAGKTVKYTVPRSTAGGLVTVELTNRAKAPHGAQLVRLEGNHTATQALAVIQGNSNRTPDWLRAEGGVGTVPPGQSQSATVNLPPGRYTVVDAGPGSSGAHADLRVTSGKAGSLPSAPASVVAAEAGRDRYRWDVSGLKAGQNRLVFKSEGKEALHLAIAVRIKGNPSLARIEKDLASNGPPPSYADLQSAETTAVLDGGKSEVTTLTLPKGQYVLFCPLADRDGGKPHSSEGLLKKVTIR